MFDILLVKVFFNVTKLFEIFLVDFSLFKDEVHTDNMIVMLTFILYSFSILIELFINLSLISPSLVAIGKFT